MFFFSRVKYAGVSAFAGCKLGNLKVGAESVFCFFFVLSKLVVGSKSQLATVDVFWGKQLTAIFVPVPVP